MPVAVGKSTSVGSLMLSEENNSSAELGLPALSRRDTEQILDYYQSEDAGRTYISSRSSYASDYSSQGPYETHKATSARSTTIGPQSATGRDMNVTHRTSMESVASSSGGIQRRTSQRSAGGADKRRLAIVEVDARLDPQTSALRQQWSDASVLHTRPPPDHSLLVRRGVDSSRVQGLALIQPDAHSFDFASISSVPSSAPATGVPPTAQSIQTTAPTSGHQRSMSDAQFRKRGGGARASPRDVGIVGTMGTMLSSSPQQVEPSNEPHRPSTSDSDNKRAHSGELTAPVFQTPRSRSPSPLPLSNNSPSPQVTISETSLRSRGWRSGHEQQLTPSVGQERDTGCSVAGPMLSDLNSGQSVIRRSPRIDASSLPTSEPPTSITHAYYDRDSHKASGRLPFKPNPTGPLFLHYQPGVHSTAGPLPSPPRHIIAPPNLLPPPRPPRMLSPPPNRRNLGDKVRNATNVTHPDTAKVITLPSLKPPFSTSRGDSDFTISAVSSESDERSREPSPAARKDGDAFQTSSSGGDQLGPKPPVVHVREGAFPASSVFLARPSQQPLPQAQQQLLDELVESVTDAPDGGPSSSSSAPTSTPAEPPLLRHSQGRPDLKREDSWVSLSAESFGGEANYTSPSSSYSSSVESSTRVATTTAASDDGLIARRRASLPVPPSEPQRRVHSLPRMPSLLTVEHSDRPQTSTPLIQPISPKKPPSSWPDPMNFRDVLIKKTAAERALAYTVKIRELTTEETGLKEWLYLTAKKERRELPSSFPPTAATSRVFAKQPRHISRGSMASEITFPIRQDSYTATDLTRRPTMDIASPISQPSTLPYPSLAHGVGVRKRSSRTFVQDSSLASPSGSSRPLGSSFFASIGRKASMKKDRPFPSSPTKTTSLRQTPQLQPRPVKLGTQPTLPGGPRAPARSAQRGSSVIYSSPEKLRLDGQSLTMSVPASANSTEVFDHQVEKLSDLLPHADKDILAGYLRRSNNLDPMLAIGTYLEDEKQGCLRHD